MKTLTNLLILAAALLTDIPTARADATFSSDPVGYTGSDPEPNPCNDTEEWMGWLVPIADGHALNVTRTIAAGEPIRIEILMHPADIAASLVLNPGTPDEIFVAGVPGRNIVVGFDSVTATFEFGGGLEAGIHEVRIVSHRVDHLPWID